MNALHTTNKHLRDQRGLTMVELMMTLLIFGVILVVINNVFFTSQTLYNSTSTRANQQMSARAGLSVMQMELRQAGCDAEPDDAIEGRLVRATADSLRVVSDFNGDGVVSTAEPSEDVTYIYDADAETIFRDPGTGPQPLITDVQNYTVQFFDAQDNVLGPLPLTAAQTQRVRSMAIDITTSTRQGGDVTATTRIAFRNLGS